MSFVLGWAPPIDIDSSPSSSSSSVTRGFNLKISLRSLVTEGVVSIVSESITVVKPSLSTVILDPVTTSSSTESAEARLKDSLLVSPTTKDVVSFCDNKPAAVTVILYGPPGLKPPAKYLPDESVVLVMVVLVGSYVISTWAPLTDPSEEDTEPEISDVSSWEISNGEIKIESNESFKKFRIMIKHTPKCEN